MPPVHSHNALHPFAQLLDLDNLLLLHVLQELRELGREASIGDFTDSVHRAPRRARSAARWGLEHCDPVVAVIRLGTERLHMLLQLEEQEATKGLERQLSRLDLTLLLQRTQV